MGAAGPYPGYRAFDPEEGEQFFGRRSETGELLRLALESRLLAVVGPPEVGKSSLVRAGVIPALPEGWRSALLRPGEDPVVHLLTALRGVLGGALPDGPEELIAGGAEAVAARVSGPLLLVVDQLDELHRYRHCRRLRDAARRDAGFVDLLAGLAATDRAQIHVLVTLREGSVESLAKIPGGGVLVQKRFELAPMAAADLRRAIERPVDGLIAAELVDEIAEAYDPRRRPGDLPVIQHGLMRAWERARRDGGGRLELRHWQEIARASGEPPVADAASWLRATPEKALRLHAEEIHRECGRRERDLVGNLFRTVVAKTSGGWARRPASIARIAELWQADPADVERAVARFQGPGRSFLMPPAGERLSPDSVVDISYDSFVWTLGSVWSHRESPLLGVLAAHGPPPAAAASAVRRAATVVGAAALPLLMAGILASWANQSLPLEVTVEEPPPESQTTEVGPPCPSGPCASHLTNEHVGKLGGDGVDRHLTAADVEGIRDALAGLLHLPKDHAREPDGGGSGDVHLTAGDLRRIRAVLDELLRGRDVHLTGAHAAEIRDGAAAGFDDLHLTGDDVERIRRAVGERPAGLTEEDRAWIRSLFRAERPAERSGTGPALQFSGLAGASPGFVYDLPGDRLGLPELGLALEIVACEDDPARYRPVVRRLATPDRPLYDDPRRCFEWTERRRGRPADPGTAVDFQGPSPPGFHYAVSINFDAGGRYAIVRRCASKCLPLEETQSE